MHSPIIAGFDRHMAVLAGAVLIGIYLGASASSEIDPFYKQGQDRSGGGSYTIDGWRGADASPPPIATAVEAPMQLVAMGRTLAPALQRYYSSYPSDAGAAGYVIVEAASEDRFANPDAEADTPDVADAVPEPALDARDCVEGDAGCAPMDDGSAPVTDF